MSTLKFYELVVRKPFDAAKRLEELEAQLNAAIDWHWDESLPGTTRQDIVDNIEQLVKK